MSLAEIIKAYNSNKADEGINYDIFYEKLFEPIRENVRDVLEIGLALHKEYKKDGKLNPDCQTSLRVWLDYFPHANVVGLDVKDFSFVKAPRVKIYRGDQGKEETLSRLVQDFPDGFDIVIDDGSHVSDHQQLGLECLFPLVRPGGYFCIEDVHIRFPHDPIRSGIRTSELMKKWQAGNWLNPGMNPARFDYLSRTIESIEFGGWRNRMVALKKR